MKSFLTLQSVDAVLGHLKVFEPLQVETVALDYASGRRLARDFIAPADLPGFDRSTVDGFAVKASSTFGASEGSPALLKLVGDCYMGKAPAFELKEGEAAQIFTGAMLPQGADSAAMIEYSRPAGESYIELSRPLAPGENLVASNEDAAAGSLLISAGKLLRPQEIGCLAAFGITSVPVYRRPVIALISTGDEVIPISREPAPGQIRDVNSHSLAALLRQAGADVQQLGVVRDNQAELKAALKAALAADIAVVSGGSSAGSRDYTVDAFMSLPEAELLAHGVAIRPGKPFILAKSGCKPLIGLPGHVSGALVCSRVFILPLLQRLQGARSPEQIPTTPAALTRSIVSAQGRRDYIRCRLSQNNGMNEATPLLAPSAVLSGLIQADGLIVCPENIEGFAKGATVMVEPI